MNRIKHISFKEIPISAVIMTILGQTPTVKLTYGSNLNEFVFDHDDWIPRVVLEFSFGQRIANAAEHEKARAVLYRIARIVKGGQGL